MFCVCVVFSASSPPSSPSPNQDQPYPVQSTPIQSTEPTTPSSQPDRSTSLSLDDSPASTSPIDNEPSYQNTDVLNKLTVESANEVRVQSTNDVENNSTTRTETNSVDSANKLTNDDSTSKTAKESIDNANIISSNDTGLTAQNAPVPTKHNNNKVEELYDIPVGKLYKTAEHTNDKQSTTE